MDIIMDTAPAFLDTTPYQDGRAYTISRDGIRVETTTNPLAWFHRTHPYSMAHALEHEGYSIAPHCDCDDPAATVAYCWQHREQYR